MKKLISISLALILLVSSFSGCSKASGRFDPELTYENNSKSILVKNLDTDISIYDVDPNRHVAMGSLAHLMTAVVVADSTADFGVKIKSNNDTFDGIENKDLPNIDMAPGESYIISELMEAMLIGDAYDAANLLAQHFGEGKIDDFVSKMNSKGDELGLKDTFFTHPSGLPGSNQHTSARDMYVIAKTIIEKYGMITEICEKINFTTAADVNQNPFSGKSNNPMQNVDLLGGQNKMDSVKGLKFTDTTQDEEISNLVVFAEENGEKYVGVFLGGPVVRPKVDKPIYSKEEAEKPPVKEPEKEPETSSGSEGEEETPVTPPEIPTDTGSIFEDAKFYLKYGFDNFKRARIAEDSKAILTIPMVGEGFGKDRLNIGLESKIPDEVTSKELLCEIPKNFGVEMKKNTVIGRAYLVGSEDGIPINLVTLEGSNAGTFGQVVKVVGQIVFVLLLAVFVLMLFVRFRNQRLNKKRRERSRAAARRAALEGKTAPHPYGESRRPKQPSNRPRGGVSAPRNPGGTPPYQGGNLPPHMQK